MLLPLKAKDMNHHETPEHRLAIWVNWAKKADLAPDAWEVRGAALDDNSGFGEAFSRSFEGEGFQVTASGTRRIENLFAGAIADGSAHPAWMIDSSVPLDTLPLLLTNLSQLQICAVGNISSHEIQFADEITPIRGEGWIGVIQRHENRTLLYYYGCVSPFEQRMLTGCHAETGQSLGVICVREWV